METRKKILLLEILPFTTGWQTLLVEKTAMINREGSVEGTIFQAIDVSDCAIFKKCLLLNDSDQKIINTVNKPASYVLNSEHSPLPLTKQQEVCLFLLVRGKSLHQIADVLSISIRTVEAHIEAMRHKLRCCSKSQVIEKAIDSGYFYYIPKDILEHVGNI